MNKRARVAFLPFKFRSAVIQNTSNLPLSNFFIANRVFIIPNQKPTSNRDPPDLDQFWQSQAFNDGDSLAWSAPQWPNSGYFPPSPFILSMHFFIGRIWDGWLKGLGLGAWFFRQIPLLYCGNLYTTEFNGMRRVKPVWEVAAVSSSAATCPYPASVPYSASN